MWIAPSVCGGGSGAMCGTTSLSLKMVKERMPASAYLKAGLFVVAAAAALFAAAGTIAIPSFWAYLAIFAVVMIVSFATLDPELLRERMRPGGKKPPLALKVFSLVLFMHWIVAGLDRGRFHWSDDVPLSFADSMGATANAARASNNRGRCHRTFARDRLPREPLRRSG